MGCIVILQITQNYFKNEKKKTIIIYPRRFIDNVYTMFCDGFTSYNNRGLTKIWPHLSVFPRREACGQLPWCEDSADTEMKIIYSGNSACQHACEMICIRLYQEFPELVPGCSLLYFHCWLADSVWVYVSMCHDVLF